MKLNTNAKELIQEFIKTKFSPNSEYEWRDRYKDFYPEVSKIIDFEDADWLHMLNAANAVNNTEMIDLLSIFYQRWQNNRLWSENLNITNEECSGRVDSTFSSNGSSPLFCHNPMRFLDWVEMQLKRNKRMKGLLMIEKHMQQIKKPVDLTYWLDSVVTLKIRQMATDYELNVYLEETKDLTFTQDALEGLEC